MAYFNPPIDFPGKIGYTSEATISGDNGRTAGETTRGQQATASKRWENARTAANVYVIVPACAQKLEPMCYNHARETGKRETERGKTLAAKY